MDKRTLLFMICVSMAFFGINAYYDSQKPKVPLVKKEQPTAALVVQTPIAMPNEPETFYVLENEYQQLVFSNRGGAIAEINLPFKDTVVREVRFDGQIVKNSPENAMFPLHSYQTPNGGTKEGVLGGYYPLLRRGINGKQLPAEYYAMSVVGSDPRIANTTYRMTEFTKNSIRFEANVSGRRIVKTFTLADGPYCFNLDVTGDVDGLWIASGLPDVEIVSNSYSPQIRIQTADKNGVSEVDDVSMPKKGAVISSDLKPNWVSNCNGFFGVITTAVNGVPSGYQTAQIDGNAVPTRLTLVDPGYMPYPAVDYPAYATYMPLSNQASFRVFAGPYDGTILKELDALYDNPATRYNPEYNEALSVTGWFSFISRPFAKLLSFLMEIFYAMTGSWAASIILLTVALKAMMFPLNNWSIKSTAKMQQIAPKVKVIQEKYKKDPKRAQMEVMNLYREAGINPLTGCFPVLLQMPFLIGMFYLLKSSFPLRGAPFIPGWIDDLSTPDVLFSWSRPIWFIGTEFHLLPILMGLTMFLQQKFTAKTPKDNIDNEAAQQQKVMGNMMSVLFTVMFYNFPSGLNIYFMLSTLLGIGQQVWMMKKMKTLKV